MNVYELAKQISPGPLYPMSTVGGSQSAACHGVCVFATGPGIAFGQGHEAEDKGRILERDFTMHCRNNFMKALAELRRLADDQAGFSEEQLVDHARVDLSLIEELETVKT